jgi:sulfatase modifying factor 1
MTNDSKASSPGSLRRSAWRLAALLGAAGCQLVGGFEEFTTATGGASGAGGSSSGKGGSSAQGGSAGRGGSAGKGGAAGTGGSAGKGGGAGTGGMGGEGNAPAACEPVSTGRGPDMLGLKRPNGECFYIDASEVTRGEYQAFLDTAPAATRYQPSLCRSYNDDYALDPECSAADFLGADAESSPVTCVEWCDAEAFCAWAGKTLCPGSFTAFTEPDESLWFAACSGNGVRDYSYGRTSNDSYCNGLDNPATGCDQGDCKLVTASDLTSCDTPEGVAHLVGNVAEWTAECNGNSGGTNRCLVRGGSISDQGTALSCQGAVEYQRDATDELVGFRCCSEARPEPIQGEGGTGS